MIGTRSACRALGASHATIYRRQPARACAGAATGAVAAGVDCG